IDLSLDGWVDDQYDKALVNKVNYLKTLVKHQPNQAQQIVFEFNPDFMPEFSAKTDPQYFQVWVDNTVVARSPSLTPYPNLNLERKKLALNSTQLFDVILPNGGVGRAVATHFKDSNMTRDHNVSLTFYEPIAGLERLLIIVDVLLVVTFFLSIFFMRTLAIRIVNSGLKPLAELNESIRSLDVNRDSQSGRINQISAPKTRYVEIEPIRLELNSYISSNQALLESEKRLTGNIAHELKTPIAEIISLTEVYRSFPDDERIAATYSQDVLQISQRMKKIVDNLLLLQRSSQSQLKQPLHVIDVEDLIFKTKQELAFKFSDIHQRVQHKVESGALVADEFSLQTLLTNLLDNALYYSPPESSVIIKLEESNIGGCLSIRNDLAYPLCEQDKQNLLEPMYQADQSRTLSDRHGLGLSIVHNLCKLYGYRLSIAYPATMQIEFIIDGLVLDE
ncbi:MAG: sensor histidine kinase, partial [Vibrio sp.]